MNKFNRNFGIRNDAIKNNLIVTNKLLTSSKNGLPLSGQPGQIIFNSSDSTFYGWNGVEWISFLGGGNAGFERVTITSSPVSLSTTVKTSLLQGTPKGSVLWGARVSGVGDEASYNLNLIAMNNSNNAFTTKRYHSNPVIIYNSNDTVAFTLALQGASDIACLKYSPSGNPELMGKIVFEDATSWYNEITAVGINDSNEMIISGYHTVSLSIWDNTVQFVKTLSSSGGRDSFLIHYNSASSIDWTVQVSTTEYSSEFTSCAINGDGYVALSCLYGNTIQIYEPNSTAFTFRNLPTGQGNLYNIKYDSQGNFVDFVAVSGANIFGAETTINNTSRLLTATGTTDLSAYDVTGTLCLTLTLGGSGFLKLAGVFKFDIDGDFIWGAALRSNSVPYSIDVNSLRTNDLNEVVLAGAYGNQLNIYNKDGSLVVTLPPNPNSGFPGNNDLFLIKWTPEGFVQWTSYIRGDDNIELNSSVAMNDFGEVALAGHANSGLVYIYDKTRTLVATLEFPDFENICIVKYTTDGDFVWAAKICGNGLEYGEENMPSIAMNNYGHIVVTGFYSSSPLNAFNSDGNCALTLNFEGYYDSYVIRYNSVGEVLLTDPEKDGQNKLIVSNGPTVLVNTTSTIDNISNIVCLTKNESIEMLWNNDEWISVNNTGKML